MKESVKQCHKLKIIEHFGEQVYSIIENEYAGCTLYIPETFARARLTALLGVNIATQFSKVFGGDTLYIPKPTTWHEDPDKILKDNPKMNARELSIRVGCSYETARTKVQRARGQYADQS